MEHYDYILAGGGAAGLSLAYQMVHGGLQDRRILIIDLDTKQTNDRTWCFWSDGATPFDSIVKKRWSHIWFHGPERSHRFSLDPYEYRMIRGIDFYEFTRRDLEQRDTVDILTARVASIEDGRDQATVILEDGRRFTADWVFDSLFLAREFRVDEERYHFLKQHFRGWVIETDQDVFDSDAATMFDLRIPQDGAFRFMYILPENERKALVEYTFFSETLLSAEEYEEGLRTYLESYYPGVAYRIVEYEDGIIPMTEQPFPRRGGERIMFTGTKGGRVKASTGFAFHRTQQDGARIVASLRDRGTPFHGITPPRRYRTFDAMLLSVLARTPERGRDAFIRLFERNPLPRLWRFLDEVGTIGENLALMATVQWGLFIAAWFRVKLGRFLR